MSNKKKIKGKGILINGDCLEVMRTIPDNTFDVAFTSPPYADKGGENKNDRGHKKYITEERTDDWLEWQESIIDELLRISKKYVLYNVQGLKSNRKNVYKIIGKYANRIHDICIWNKQSAQPTGTKHKLSNRYEFLLIIKCDGVKGVDVQSDFYWNVIDVKTKTKNVYSKIHGAVMNKEFCDEIIKEFTQEGDYVIDPFGGMATTAICCIEQNRKFCYIEKEKLYCKEAYKRIKNKLKEAD